MKNILYSCTVSLRVDLNQSLSHRRESAESASACGLWFPANDTVSSGSALLGMTHNYSDIVQRCACNNYVLQ